MQLLGLYLVSVASAGWFPRGFLPSSWTGSGDKDENMRTDAKSSLLQTAGHAKATGDADTELTEQLQGLSQEVDDASTQDTAESESIKSSASQALANLENLKIDVESSLNKTVSGRAQVQQAGTAITNSATKAKQSVQAVVDLDKSATAEMTQAADLLTEKAANSGLAIDAKGSTYLQKMKGDFDVAYLTADQSISRDLTDITSMVNKVKQSSNSAMDKAEVGAEMLSSDLDGMSRKLQDNNADLAPKIKDLNSMMKGDTKDSKKMYDTLMKQVKKDIADEEPVDEKDSLKVIKKAREEVEDQAEESLDDAEDRVDDLDKVAEKSLKATNKLAEKDAKSMTKSAEKNAMSREKEIKKMLKAVDGGIDDTKDLEDSIKSDVVDAVESHTRTMQGKLSEKTTQAAVDQSTMFKRTSENAEKNMQAVQVSADAAAAKMNSDNGRDAADAASSSYKVVQNIDEEAQTVAMNINNKIGGVTSTVSTAKNSVAGASDSLADVDAEIEAAQLMAKSQQEKAAALAGRSTTKMAADVNALDLDMKIKMESAQTDLRNEKDAFAAKSSSVKQALEMPITQKAEGVARALESEMNQMSIKTNEQMGELKAQLKNVKASMQAIGVSPDSGAPAESKVLDLVTKAMHDMQTLQRSKISLEKDVQGTPQWVETKTQMATKELESYARKAQQDIVKGQLDQIRKTESAVFHSLGTEAKKMDQLKGKTVASEDRDQQQSEYLERRISELVDDMGKFKTNHDEVSTLLKSKTSEFSDQLMPAFAQKASAASESVKQAAESTLQAGEEGLQHKLHEDGARMTADAEQKAQATQSDIESEEDKILKVFEASKSSESAQLNKLYTASEALKFDTKNATEMLQEEQDKATDEATKADESAQMVQAKVGSQTQNAEEEAHDMDDMVTKMAQESIDYAKRQAQADISSKGEEMDEAVAKLASKASGISSSADLQVKGTLNSFDTLGREAKEKLKGIQEKSEFAQKDQEAFAQNVRSQVEEEGKKEEDEEENIERGLNQEQSKFNIGEKRNKEIVKVMEEDAKDVRQEADDKLNEVKAKVDAKTKAMSGKIDASFESAKMTAGTAHDSLEASKIDLAAARGTLISQMNSVQGELNRKANETARAIESFEAGIASEKEMLDKNEAYLRAYDLTVQSQILALLQKVEDTIGGAADTAAGGFKEVEETERAIMAKMDEQAGSSAFTQLAKIMDADNYVQKAAIENSELVSYMKEFKTDQETFMTALIKALYDAQYAVILHENEVALEQSAIDADSGALTNNVIGKLHALVDGNATDGEAAELEGMTESTLQMLLAKAANGSESDKAQIALLMKKINANGMGGLAHLKNAQGLVDAINQAVSGNGNYEAMKADLQAVVDFNQKLVDDERKRMEARGVKLSDALFFGGADMSTIKTPEAFKHVKLADRNKYMNQAVLKVQDSYSREAFLERQRKQMDASTAAARKALEQAKPKTAAEKKRWQEMHSLLAKNQKLMEENKQLSQEHAHWGHTIREVTQKVKGAPHAASF
jgi:hypothetical protein